MWEARLVAMAPGSKSWDPDGAWPGARPSLVRPGVGLLRDTCPAKANKSVGRARAVRVWGPYVLYCCKGLVINYGEGGGVKMGKLQVQNFLRPPLPRDRVKRFAPPSPF